MLPRCPLLCLVLLTASIASTSRGDDWPQWMGPHRDGIWTEPGIVRTLDQEGPPILWRKAIHSGYSGPAVAGKHLFVMDFQPEKERSETPTGGPASKEDQDRQRMDAARSGLSGLERVLCLDATTGTEAWVHSDPRTYTINYPDGPRTTPTVDGNRVYTLGAMGHLTCLDCDQGTVLWQKDLPKTYHTKPPIWGYAAHPLIDGNKVICSVGGDGSAIVALDKFTGAEIWKAVTAKEIGYVPPRILEYQGKRQLIFWYDAAVVGLDPETGKQAWDVKFPIVPSGQVTVAIAQPGIAGNQLLISEYYSGSMLIQLNDDLSSAEPVWNSEPGDQLHKDGLNTLMTPPLVEGGHIYGVSGDGELRCLELHTGKLLWRDDQATSKKKREDFGTFFWARNGGRLYLFNDKGYLKVAAVSPQGYEEFGSVKVLEPTGFTRGREFVWSPPAFANGCMFARNNEELICVDLRQKT